MPTMPTLYFAPGTCARVSLTALEEIGEPFETKLIAFMRGDHRSAEFLGVNPSGKVPALVTDEGTITQNAAILWYLAHRYPQARLLPVAPSPIDQAHLIRQLAHFSADIHPLVSRIAVPFLFAGSPEGQSQVRESGMAAIRLHLGAFEAQLSRVDWLAGDDWSVLDSYLGWVWFRIMGAGFEGAGFPMIAAHYDRLKSRPAVQRCLAREAAAQADLVASGLAAPSINNEWNG